MLLENIVELFDYEKLNKELDSIINKLDLYEAVKIDPIDKKASVNSLMNLMGDAIVRFTAARKGMGIVNKLKDPADRKKHASKVMSNINKLRGLMQRLDKAIAKASGGKTPVNESFTLLESKDMSGRVAKQGNKFYVDREDIDTGKTLVKPNDTISFKINGKKMSGVVSSKTKGRDEDVYLVIINEADGGGKLKSMDKEAQAVWTAKGVEAKKAAMGAMIDAFHAKEKQPKFRAQLEKAKSANAIDTMAGNVMQIASGNRVIK